MILRFKKFIPILAICALCVSSVWSQADKKEDKKSNNSASAKNMTAEQVIESAILIYGFGGGRELLKQIRKTTIERGKTSVLNSEGKAENASYQRFIVRADNLSKEKIRLDQEFPTARYALILNDEKVSLFFNDAFYTPREDVSRAFQNQIYYSIEAMLRYKENESKVELAGRDKKMGVEFYLVDVTDKQNRKTRFFVSVKTLRVMMLEYEDNGSKFRRKFYNHNYAQGTLVPFRSILWQDDKIVEETEISTITFGQRVDEDMFKVG